MKGVGGMMYKSSTKFESSGQLVTLGLVKTDPEYERLRANGVRA